MRLAYASLETQARAAALSGCPKCGGELIQSVAFGRRELHCPHGHGRGYSLAALHHWIQPEFLTDFESALKRRRKGKRHCALCHGPVHVAQLGSVPFEVCDNCSHAWLTEKAVERLPWKNEEERLKEAGLREHLDFTPTALGGLPLADPFTNLSEKPMGFPVTTIALFAFCIFVTLQLWHSPRHWQYYVFQPLDPFAYFGSGFVLSLFSHGSTMHLLGNGYFLFFAGRALETTLGWRRLLFLFFASGFGSNFLSALSGDVPSLGASGAISGMLMALVLSQPQAKFRMGLDSLPIPLPVAATIRVPLWLWFGKWLFANYVLMQFQMSGGNVHIDYAGHIGGALTAMVLVLGGLLPRTEAGGLSTGS